MENNLTHINRQGRAKMVDVGQKDITHRVAIASGRIQMQKETLQRIKEGGIKKGDVLSVAQVAGIMAAKRTSDIISMAHPIIIEGVDIEFIFGDNWIKVISTVKCTGKTGVEMEALCAVSGALLTIYDMCKAIDRSMEIQVVRLDKKTGGKSGTFERNTND